MESKIILGTANFQKKYGLAKKKIKSINEIKKIAKFANKNNLFEFDNALSYSAENTLKYFPQKKIKVNTKIPALDFNKNIRESIFLMIEKSLKKLKIKNFESILLHQPSQLFERKGKEIIKSLEELKKYKLTKKIGYSVYSPVELKNLIKIHKPDLVQIPISIADKRFKKNFLKKLKSLNIELHGRSIFLQGLLTTNEDKRPKYFPAWKKELIKWDNYIKKKNLNPIKVCIDFVNSKKEIDKFIVGFNSSQQLKEITNNLKKKSTSNFINLKNLNANFLIP
tara:strand:+ start:188 stop:1030 length:843 start_codon:yes stop_codon:yes gene_type:complete